MSSYIQSIYLIDQTIYIIEDKIIRGNPLLYLNFSGVNLTTLTFVNSILRGINSPLILFFMSIWIQQLHASSHKIACLPEKPVLKDPFLYRYPLFSLWFTLSLTSFLSINLITLNYSLTILIEMIFSTTTFVLAVMGMLFSYQWKQSNGYSFSPSKSSYKHQIAFIILKVHIMFTVLLLIYHLIGIYLDHDYGFRFVNVILSIISQIALYLIHKRLHAID